MSELRENFRVAVFTRDGHRCVVCDKPAEDAHHLIERRLWKAIGDPEDGYIIDNGVSVCAEHHRAAERTEISVEDLRDYAGITRVVLPAELDPGHTYDKWGNRYQPDGMRIRGPLFHDESVQEVLKSYLDDFVPYEKFPRTAHLPWSGGIDDGELVIGPLALNQTMPIVVTEKMDGENTTMYHDYIHTRSLDYEYHPSRTWVKNFWASIKHDIPTNMRICGENMYATHSIKYTDLESYFLGFAIFQNNACLSWHDTMEWFWLLGITPVPVLFAGNFNDAVDVIHESKWPQEGKEGYVLRAAGEFPTWNYGRAVAKYVRPNHVSENDHWRVGQFNKNQLRDKD